MSSSLRRFIVSVCSDKYLNADV
uniref:Uncharacterized protein n=1 Tax=Anguilla anguilla TaxID=7936 RepID=A0A0E9T1G1_ANGAN